VGPAIGLLDRTPLHATLNKMAADLVHELVTGFSSPGEIRHYLNVLRLALFPDDTVDTKKEESLADCVTAAHAAFVAKFLAPASVVVSPGEAAALAELALGAFQSRALNTMVCCFSCYLCFVVCSFLLA
jgi:hypothetical protein